jgi:hypothetical protein
MVHLPVVEVVHVVAVQDLGMAAPAVVPVMVIRDRPMGTGASSTGAAW